MILAVLIVRQTGRIASSEGQRARDAQTIEQLRADLRRQQERNAMTAAPHREPPPEQPRGRSGAPYRPEIAVRDTAIENLNRELEEAHDGMARLQAQLRSANAEKEQALAATGESFQRREQDYRVRLETLQRELDSAREEAQAAHERVAGLEADLAKMPKENPASSVPTSGLRKEMASLQDLDRRRDAYLNSVIRRYRDITDQFRAMSGVLDSSRAPESAPFSGVALSRIQNAMSLAEDDLRRLGELNAQAHQLESKLAKK